MTSQQQVHPERQKRVDTALKFFTVAATITGIFLVILVIRMVLEYIVGMEMPDWATLIAEANGLAYMVYLLASMNLTPKALWSVCQWFTTASGGFICLCSCCTEIKRRHHFKQ